MGGRERKRERQEHAKNIKGIDVETVHDVDYLSFPLYTFCI